MTEQVLAAALALPEEERLELIEALLASSTLGDGAPLDAAWLATIQRRSAELDARTVTPVPWAEVKERVRLFPTPAGSPGR